MNIADIGTPGALRVAPDSARHHDFKLGQVVTATVVARRADRPIELSIGGQRLWAQSDAPLQTGTSVQLRVVDLDPPTLQLLQDASVPPDVRVKALRYALARATDVSQVIQTLRDLQGNGLIKDLGGPLNRIFEQLAANVPTAKAVQDPAALKNALLACGIFLENKLQGPEGDATEKRLANDVKATLLRLHQLVSESADHDPILHRLLNETEGALARITVNQLASSHRPGDGTALAWHLSIPVVDDDTVDEVHLRIRRERKRSKANAPAIWSVSLGFSTAKLGDLHAKLVLVDRSLSACFWAERPETYTLIKTHQHVLHRVLQETRLQITAISIFQGKPKYDTDSAASGRNLVDTTA